MEEEQTQAASQATFEQRLEVSAPPDSRQTRSGPTGDQEIESDWSDVEERKPVPPTAGAMELEEGPGGEIKSKHEIKLKPFAITETDSQRETR